MRTIAYMLSRAKARKGGTNITVLRQISVICHVILTRKLSYRKDDRAMRPMYGWHWVP